MLLEQIDTELRKEALGLQSALTDKLPMLDVKLKYIEDPAKLVPSHAACSHAVMLTLTMSQHDVGRLILGRRISTSAVMLFSDGRGEDNMASVAADYSKRRDWSIKRVLIQYIAFPMEADPSGYQSTALAKASDDFFVEYNGHVYSGEKLTKERALKLKAGDVVACIPPQTATADVMTVTSYVNFNDPFTRTFTSYADVDKVDGVRLCGVNENNGELSSLNVGPSGLKPIYKPDRIGVKALLLTKV